MGKGIPLTDADRKGWLEILSSNANRASQHGNVVVTCSALKKKYRTSLKDELPRDVAVHFVFLDASEEELVRRVTSRESTGHYMKADMIRSQLRDLEKPGGEERDAVTVNVERPLGEVVDDVVAVVRSLSAGDNSL